MKKPLLPLVILFVLFLPMIGCGTDGEDDCPGSAGNTGKLLFCLRATDPWDDGLDGLIKNNAIEKNVSTSNGIYDEGTEVTAAAEHHFGDIYFRGWFTGPPDEGGEFISDDNPYVFILLEDTFLTAYYDGGY